MLDTAYLNRINARASIYNYFDLSSFYNFLQNSPAHVQAIDDKIYNSNWLETGKFHLALPEDFVSAELEDKSRQDYNFNDIALFALHKMHAYSKYYISSGKKYIFANPQWKIDMTNEVGFYNTLWHIYSDNFYLKRPFKSAPQIAQGSATVNYIRRNTLNQFKEARAAFDLGIFEKSDPRNFLPVLDKPEYNVHLQGYMWMIEDLALYSIDKAVKHRQNAIDKFEAHRYNWTEEVEEDIMQDISEMLVLEKFFYRTLSRYIDGASYH